MSQGRRFRPILTGPLEERVLLDAGARIGPTIAPVAIAPLDVSGRGRVLAQRAVDQVNVAFDGFTRDYLQAQGAYFSSTPSMDAATDPKRYFLQYVNQRLNLLSQQLTRLFVQLPGGTNRLSSNGPGGSIVLQSFLRGRITGNGVNSLHRALVGTTGNANSIVIPPPGTSTGSATLYTTQALAAIDTARTATLNASSYLIRNTFQNGHKS